MTAAEISETDIAIVGMAGHFPGASDVDELWARVVERRRLPHRPVARRPRCALASRGQRSARPSYVRRNGLLDEVEYFDPQFFGIGPRDAAIMDPAAPPLPRVRVGGARGGRRTCPSASTARSACSPGAA